MHEIFDGPLKRLAAKHLQEVDPGLIHIPGIIIPAEITSRLEIGKLSEDFKLENVRGSHKQIEDILLALATKLYACLKWKAVIDRVHQSCYFSPDGEEGDIGVLLVYSIFHDSHRLDVTVQDF